MMMMMMMMLMLMLTLMFMLTDDARDAYYDDNVDDYAVEFDGDIAIGLRFAVVLRVV